MTIKETAGKMLLYFYQLQRTVPLSMPNRQLGFIEKKGAGGLFLTSDKKWLTNDLLAINPSSLDVFNAYLFLRDKGFIDTKERLSGEARIYVGVQLTAAGIDTVEGIEGGEDGRQAFAAAFNIPVEHGADIESVIKDSLRNLVGE